MGWLLLVWGPHAWSTAPADELLHGGAWTSKLQSPHGEPGRDVDAESGVRVGSAKGSPHHLQEPQGLRPALGVSPSGTVVTGCALQALPCCSQRRPGQNLCAPAAGQSLSRATAVSCSRYAKGYWVGPLFFVFVLCFGGKLIS